MTTQEIIDSLTAELTDRDNQIAALTQQNTDLQASASGVSGTIADLQSQLTTCQSDLTDCMAGTELNALRAENTTLQQTIEALQAQINAAKVALQ